MSLYKKIFFAALFLPFVALSSNGIKKHEKTKTISKKFTVNSNASVFIKNKYGNLNVTTWNKNTVEIDVRITVKGNDLDKVQDKLEDIRIDFEASEGLVEARTIIEKTKSSWSFWGKSNNINYKINYFVKMPITNNADLNNKYGNIELDIIEGKANINCDYGAIQVEKLLNSSNSISLDYCRSSNIQYMKSGTLNVDYSKITVDEVEKIKVNADYSGVKVGTVNDISFNSDYGSITIEDGEYVDGNSDYAGMRIGTLRKSLRVNTDYGGLKVKNLAKGFENVTIDGSYAGIKIGTARDNNFDFTVNLSYSGFKYPKEYVETYKAVRKTTKKYYEGSFGKANSGSKINIKSDYGGVSLQLND
ncbi:hypothetical protein [Tenacibaculum jejuense]|uniref:Adhesin domain-containing protein n=1 Tax=Tenacibaculum jejuense TaxID=584609 RepID=A0A238UBR3_9FLAO|nr:hypothetical protein [Tenacibaculum jejuense]SNR16018.1 conserved exported protein of unknown function [Tenacibaculum jejuense]